MLAVFAMSMTASAQSEWAFLPLKKEVLNHNGWTSEKVTMQLCFRYGGNLQYYNQGGKNNGHFVAWCKDNDRMHFENHSDKTIKFSMTYKKSKNGKTYGPIYLTIGPFETRDGDGVSFPKKNKTWEFVTIKPVEVK